MSEDTISRQAAIGAIEEYADRLQMVNWKENPGVPYKVSSLNWCINTIRDLPSIDAVPVIRCKDCEYYTEDERWCIRLGLYGAFDADDYCSKAERKEE